MPRRRGQQAAQLEAREQEARPFHQADFTRAVWQVAKKIPHGKVTSYGQLAAMLGYPRHARHVGQALKMLPPGMAARPGDDIVAGMIQEGAAPPDVDTIPVPWHRVVNSSGIISPRGSNRAVERQAEMLRAEGVIVNDGQVQDYHLHPEYAQGMVITGGRVNMRTYGWFPTTSS